MEGIAAETAVERTREATDTKGVDEERAVVVSANNGVALTK